MMHQVTQRPSLERLERIGQWVALMILAVSLQLIESALPSLGPWFKLGMANIVTLIALARLGCREAFTLAVFRVIVSAFFLGTLLTPTFVMSLSGAVAAASTMILAWRWIPGIGLIGVSLIGAEAHMVAQCIVVERLYIHHDAIYVFMPTLLLVSLLAGWLNGALANAVTGNRVKTAHA